MGEQLTRAAAAHASVAQPPEWVEKRLEALENRVLGDGGLAAQAAALAAAEAKLGAVSAAARDSASGLFSELREVALLAQACVFDSDFRFRFSI